MSTATSRSLRRIAALIGMLLVLSAAVAGCSRPASQGTPTSSAPAAQAPAPAPKPSKATTPTAKSEPGVEAAGAAIGSSLTVGKSNKGSGGGGIARPTNKAATDAAVRLLRADDQIGKVESISVRSMTRDKKGHWWVLISVKDDKAGNDQAVLTYDGKTWDDVVFGEGVSNDDLPPDVRF